MRKPAGLAALLAIASPAVAQDASPPWSEQDVAWSAGDGRNAVTGTALLRTRGGEPRTCAGLEVSLVPKSPYADDRIARIYGNNESGYQTLYRYPKLEPAPPGYKAAARSTRCDGQGYFSFDAIPDGTYYVVSVVTWEAAGRYGMQAQGGSLMARVAVSGGQTKRVVLGE
jgi:hypothetical protein